MRERFNRTIRLKGFSYTASRWYFVTICTEGRRCNLSRVEGTEVRLSKFGRVAESALQETKAKRPYVLLGPTAIMPNHVHVLIGLACTIDGTSEGPERAILEVPNQSHALVPESLGAVIGAFKSATTREVNRLRGTPGAPYWQKGFYEHIVRNESDWEAIASYILFNPINWHIDRDNPDATPSEQELRFWRERMGL